MKTKRKLFKKKMVSLEEKVRCGDKVLTVEGLAILMRRVTVSAIVEVKWRLSRWVRNSNGSFKLHVPYLERNERSGGRWKG